MTLAWGTAARIQFEGDAHVIEDACGFAGPTAWMIDGATSLLEPLGLPAASDPQWLAQVLNLELGRGAGPLGVPFEADDGARGALVAALRAVDARATELVGAETVRFPSAAISVARLNSEGVEIAALADCTVVVETDEGAIHMVQAELADARVELLASRGAADPDERRRLLIRDRELRNTPGHVWVARREAEAADHAHVVQLGRPARMVMASDGAWRAVDLGLVSGPEEFLERTQSTLAALELMTELRRKQAAIGEVSDDATVMTLEPRR